MSKERTPYWVGAKGAVRRYPALKAELEGLRKQSLTASASGMPGSGGENRITETVALTEMKPSKQADYEAVHKAIAITRMKPTGKERMDLIRLMYWSKMQLTLDGAAQKIPCSEGTAKRWHREFIHLVLKLRGLED